MCPTTIELMHATPASQDSADRYAPPQVTTAETDTRHSCWRCRRQQLRAAIATDRLSGRRLDRWDNCGACAVIEESPSTHKVRVTCWHCHDRLCMPCQRRRSQALRDAIDYNAHEETLRFITLTQRHRDETLADSIERLRTNFTKLRRGPLWKSHVTGGAASLEVKLAESGQWHVHMHCIVAGDFIDQGDLADAWLATTGDSTIVDIRIIKDLDRASYYCTKYITKPIDSYTLSQPEKLAEFAQAIKGCRTYSLLGNWKKPPERPDADDPGDWQPVATVCEWHHAMQLELPWALLLAERMKDCRWLQNNPEPGG